MIIIMIMPREVGTPAGRRQDDPAGDPRCARRGGRSGVRKGGFGKGGFSNLCVIIIVLLLNHSLLNTPL